MFVNPVRSLKMSTRAEELYEKFMLKRNFNAIEWTQAKVEAIQSYCSANSITHVIIGVSGGIDSAVAHALLQRAAQHGKSKGRTFKVLPFTIPIHNSGGTTGQHDATTRAKLLNIDNSVSSDVKVIDFNGYNTAVLAMMQSSITDALSTSANLEHRKPHLFGKGQLDYYLRPMYLYGIAGQLNGCKGTRAIVCGTINKSEALLGYFGKKTDTCDIQIISDIYKSEVYDVADHLGIHEDIINATPEGGLYSGKSDAEEIGAPYKYIEFIVDRWEEGKGFNTIGVEWENTIMQSIQWARGANSHKWDDDKSLILDSIII